MVGVKLQGVEKMNDEEDCLSNNSDNSIHNSKFDSMFNLRVHYMFNSMCKGEKILTGDGTKASLYFLGFILSTPLKREWHLNILQNMPTV